MLNSDEVVLPDDSREIVSGFSLHRCGHSLELFESHWIMNAFFEQVKFWLANSHKSVHFEQAFSGIVEWLKTYGFKSQTNDLLYM